MLAAIKKPLTLGRDKAAPAPNDGRLDGNEKNSLNVSTSRSSVASARNNDKISVKNDDSHAQRLTHTANQARSSQPTPVSFAERDSSIGACRNSNRATVEDNFPVLGKRFETVTAGSNYNVLSTRLRKNPSNVPSAPASKKDTASRASKAVITDHTPQHVGVEKMVTKTVAVDGTIRGQSNKELDSKNVNVPRESTNEKRFGAAGRNADNSVTSSKDLSTSSSMMETASRASTAIDTNHTPEDVGTEKLATKAAVADRSSNDDASRNQFAPRETVDNRSINVNRHENPALTKLNSVSVNQMQGTAATNNQMKPKFSSQNAFSDRAFEKTEPSASHNAVRSDIRSITEKTASTQPKSKPDPPSSTVSEAISLNSSSHVPGRNDPSIDMSGVSNRGNFHHSTQLQEASTSSERASQSRKDEITLSNKADAEADTRAQVTGTRPDDIPRQASNPRKVPTAAHNCAKYAPGVHTSADSNSESASCASMEPLKPSLAVPSIIKANERRLSSGISTAASTVVSTGSGGSATTGTTANNYIKKTSSPYASEFATSYVPSSAIDFEMVTRVFDSWENGIKRIPSWDYVAGEKFLRNIWQRDETTIPVFGFSPDTDPNDPRLSQDMAYMAKSMRYIKVIDFAVSKMGPDMSLIEDELIELGARHSVMNCRAQHWPVVGESLMYVLEELLGDQFTRDVRESWTVIFNFFSHHMVRGLIRANPNLVSHDSDPHLSMEQSAEALNYPVVIEHTVSPLDCTEPVSADDITYDTVMAVTASWDRGIKCVPDWSLQAGYSFMRYFFKHTGADGKKSMGYSQTTEWNDPELEHDMNFRSKGKRILEGIDTAMDLLGPDVSQVESIMFDLGRRHYRMNCYPEQWPLVGEALFSMFRDCMGPDGAEFTSEVEKAWTLVFKFFGYHMIQGLIAEQEKVEGKK